ncbi:hypothetical protein [uncultured Rheinheimera sp.]|uniref:hypothetical protein n=1 Tax=uncultured Rheinheimera sp. TaxID=400532 RepID=UPI002598FB89|nr:hypothetical protein [uncultured Rheinheimera sp.]
MAIILSPIACGKDDEPPLINDDVITYRGKHYDFTKLVDDAEIEIGEPFLEPVTRRNGEIHCKLQYMYNWDTSEDYQSMDWSDYTFPFVSGRCPCPIKRRKTDSELIPVARDGQLESITLKTQPLTHTSARDFLNSCATQGLDIEWQEGDAWFNRIWTVTGPSDALMTVAKKARELFSEWRFYG